MSNTSVKIQQYSDKSFVVVGDTKSHKNALKELGGSWNSNLTDKKSLQKFGGWLFWEGKRATVQEWIDDGCPEFEVNNTSNIEKRLETIEQLLRKLLNQNSSSLGQLQAPPSPTRRKGKSYTIQSQQDTDEDIEEPVEEVPVRLLRKKK